MIDRGWPPRRQVNPWFVAVAVVIPTFMQVVDTTVANVALRYIAGGLSAAFIDAEWVITSYLAANAFILPITGWISDHVGRRNYLLASIAVFTLASALCGMSASLGELVSFRILQGLAGGGLQPSSQGVLLDSFPREKQGAAMTMFGVAALLGPIIGPTLGGWLVDAYGWRYIFYINLPTGAIGFLACYVLLDDPDYLKQRRSELMRGPLNFDGIGLSLLALAMASWEVMLSRGQQWDWLGDPYWRVQTLLIIFVVASVSLIVRELTFSSPVINLRVLKDRNLTSSCIIIFCAFAVLYAATVALPMMLQSLFGYNALLSGLVMAPPGFFAIGMMLLVGFLLGRQTDARWLTAPGLLVTAAGTYWMAKLSLQADFWQLVWPRVVMIIGLSLIFAPINVAAFLYLPKRLRGAAVGLLALLRNEGGSFGTSMGETIQERREQFHLARLGDNLSVVNPHVQSFLDRFHTYFMRLTGEPVHSKDMAVKALSDIREQQASAMAYLDLFWLSAAIGAGLVVLVLLMKRSVAEKETPLTTA